MQQCCAWVHHHSDTYRQGISLPVILEPVLHQWFYFFSIPFASMQSADWSASCGPPHIASTSTHMYLSAPHRESGTLPAVRRGPASNPPPASVLQKIPQNPVYPGIFPSRNSCTPVLACCFHIFCKSLQIRSLPVTAVSQKNKIRALSFISGRYSRPAFSRKTGPYTGPAFSWRRPRLPGDGFQR